MENHRRGDQKTMKYTDEEFKKACQEAYDLLSDLQSAEQNGYKSYFDEALSEAMTQLSGAIDGETNDLKER